MSEPEFICPLCEDTPVTNDGDYCAECFQLCSETDLESEYV